MFSVNSLLKQMYFRTVPSPVPQFCDDIKNNKAIMFGSISSIKYSIFVFRVTCAFVMSL